MVYLLKIVIFHGYVSLPEGNRSFVCLKIGDWPHNLNDHFFIGKLIDQL